MTNILVLVAGRSKVGAEGDGYPLCLTELDGVPLIERIVRNAEIAGGTKFIFALREEDIRTAHLDDVVRLLVADAQIVTVRSDTGGAACTALLAAGHIDNDEELLVINGNEILHEDFAVILGSFRAQAFDAGTVTFASIHPRYSYVRLNADGLVVEAAEKRPISRHATAGFYWFARGRDFVCAAKSMIRKDAAVNGAFYICPTLNELVLKQARIGAFQIEASKYQPLKTDRQVQQYEQSFDARKPR